MKCGYQIGRHSKSIDVSKKCCGLCRGKFELIVNGKVVESSSQQQLTVDSGSDHCTTPNLKSNVTPNKFAMFVKDNYKNCRTPGTTHADVMKTLSSQFAQTKLSAKNLTGAAHWRRPQWLVHLYLFCVFRRSQKEIVRRKHHLLNPQTYIFFFFFFYKKPIPEY